MQNQLARGACAWCGGECIAVSPSGAPQAMACSSKIFDDDATYKMAQMQLKSMEQAFSTLICCGECQFQSILAEQNRMLAHFDSRLLTVRSCKANQHYADMDSMRMSQNGKSDGPEDVPNDAWKIY